MSTAPTIRVLVLAAYPAVRAGLRAMLEGSPGITVVGEVSPAALDVADLPDATLVLAELNGDADTLLAALVDLLPGVPAVFLADALPPLAATSGPRAWLQRDATAEELVATIHAVAAGLVVFDATLAPAASAAAGSLLDSGASDTEALTGRELDVLRQLALGLPNKAIAFNLGISEHTVKFHVSALLAKLDAASRTEAVMLAARRGLLPL